VGTRKLLATLHITFNHLGLKVGRDELFRILRKYDFLSEVEIPPKLSTYFRMKVNTTFRHKVST
jgi:hypothetical protein